MNEHYSPELQRRIFQYQTKIAIFMAKKISLSIRSIVKNYFNDIFLATLYYAVDATTLEDAIA